MVSLVTSCSILFRVRLHSSNKLLSKYLSSSSSSAARCSALESPDVAQLAETARIALSPKEAQDFAPKIKQVIDWFGQLQRVDLESIEPSLRADTDVGIKPRDKPRDDVPEEFDNREAILAEIPSFSDPYIKVPKVLNKE